MMDELDDEMADPMPSGPETVDSRFSPPRALGPLSRSLEKARPGSSSFSVGAMAAAAAFPIPLASSFTGRAPTSNTNPRPMLLALGFDTLWPRFRRPVMWVLGFVVGLVFVCFCCGVGWGVL